MYKLSEIEALLQNPSLDRATINKMISDLNRHSDQLVSRQERIKEIETHLCILLSQLDEEPRFGSIQEMLDHVTNPFQVETLKKLLARDEDSRIYLENYEKNDKSNKKNLEGTFTVLGSIRNDRREQYEIRFFQPHSNDKGMFYCSCPDHKFNSSKKNIVCKHICFIVCRVGKILDTRFFETKQLSERQFEALIAKIENKKELLSDRSLSKAASRAQFHVLTKEISADDQCPICFDEMTTDDVVSCPSCANYIHKACISVWLERSTSCVLCRSEVWREYRR